MLMTWFLRVVRPLLQEMWGFFTTLLRLPDDVIACPEIRIHRRPLLLHARSVPRIHALPLYLAGIKLCKDFQRDPVVPPDTRLMFFCRSILFRPLGFCPPV